MPFSGQDETKTCVDCRCQFIFTVGEQKFFEEKGFTDPPKRCKPCRDIRKAQKAVDAGLPPQQPQQTFVDEGGGYGRGDERPRRNRFRSNGR